MSINWKKSAELNRCSIDKLKIWFGKHPKSHKKVVAVCEGDFCEKPERIIIYKSYHDLCISCGLKKRYEDIDERKKTGEASKKAHRDDPTLTQRQSEAQLKRYEDPKEHEKQSNGLRKRFEDPKEREKLSIIHKKRYAEMDDPGSQMVTHHYIYDFNDLDKYTIEVTRSEHSTIHNNLRHIGLEVPHINIMVND